MPATQSSYNETMRPALPGMIADTKPQVILSRVVESASGLGFGVVAVKGTGDRQVRPAAAGAPFVGVTIIDPTVQHLAQPAGSPDFYPDKDVCAVIDTGTVWVTVGEAVAAGDAAYFVPATGAIMKTATNNTPIPGGKFETSAGNGALAILRMR